MVQGFSNKAVLITGAAGGIGRATALKFAQGGAFVCAVDRDEGALRDIVSSCEAYGVNATGIIGDVSEPQTAASAVKACLDAQCRIDVLINIAGENVSGSVHELSVEDWKKSLDVNLTGHYNFCHAAWPYMAKARSGVILNTASVMGQVGGAKAIGYAPMKAAIIMMTKCLAIDGASIGLRANCVAPGFVNTDGLKWGGEREDRAVARINRAQSLQPQGRMGMPDEIAEVFAFLASDASSYINGECVTVDGAVTAAPLSLAFSPEKIFD